MKQLQYIPLILALLLYASCPSLAQKRKDEAKITIRIDGVEQDIETYFEEWGKKLEKSIEDAFDDDMSISIDIDDEDLDLVIDNFSVAIGEIVESVTKAVASAVTHMDIEISDIDRKDIDDADVRLHGTEIEDLIDEIEDRYDSKVEKVEKMKVKVREDYIKIDMDVRLQNGRKVNKVQVIPKE
jgi:hypothetical protein